MKTDVHLICGPIGAGKTTFANALAEETSAMLFSIDQWMIQLYGPDAPKNLTPDWYEPRVARCERQIWTLVEQASGKRVASVLDLGFQQKRHREKIIDWSIGSGLTPVLHVMDAPREERWTRVERRNDLGDAESHLRITRPMFDFIESRWAPPTGAELQWVKD